MMQRLLVWTVGRFIRWLGPATFLALLLLATALGSVAWALAEVVRGPGLGLLLTVALGALLLGWILAAARPVPAWLAAGLIAVIVVEAVLWQVGELSGPVWRLNRALTEFLWQSWRWPLAGLPEPEPELAPLNLAVAEVGLALSQLLSRLYLWLAALLAGDSRFDLLAITIAWTLAVAGAAAWAGWGVRRLRQPLLAILPAGALLGTTLAYTLRPIGAFLPLVGATILLVGLAAQRGREQRWQAARFDYATDIRLEVGLAVGATAMVLVVIAAIVPNLAITGIARRVQEFFNVEAINQSLGLRPGARSGALPVTLRAPGLPQQHLLGSGPELSAQVVMWVKTGDPGPTGPTEITPHYWRSLTYDSYTGRGWTTSDVAPLNYEAGEAARAAAGPGRRLVRQEVELSQPGNGLLYTAGELVLADPAYTVYWRTEDDTMAATIRKGVLAYRADSLIPAVSAAELRAAGVDYPGWLRARYLALPPELPERVQTLAQQLTTSAASPYDQAKAIEAYLRSFPYSLEVAEPPPGRDVVDYFLFDLQRGYCDYYATAMVVLARAAGRPARLAVGYIGGRYQAESGRYLVSEAEAHSWPELYFPEYGWINFEPTGGRPALERPVEAESHPSAPPLVGEVSKKAGSPVGIIWPALLAGVGLVLLAGLGGRAWDSWRLRRAAPAATVATLYWRLYRHGPRLAVPPQPADTPYEFAATLSRRLTKLAAASRWPEFLAAGAAEIDHLAGLYVHTRFSAQPPDRASQAQAIRAWQRLRRRLWLAWLYRVTGVDERP